MGEKVCGEFSSLHYYVVIYNHKLVEVCIEKKSAHKRAMSLLFFDSMWGGQWQYLKGEVNGEG